MNKRPTITYEIKLAAAREVVKTIRYDIDPKANDEDMAKDIADCGSWHDDGYSLAKQLDDMKHWYIDEQYVEALANFPYYLSRELDKAIKKWVDENEIKPPFPIKTRVKLHTGETGEITTIRRETAEYLIKIDGDSFADGPSQRRRVSTFESVTELGM